MCNFFFISPTANESLLLRLVSLQNADGSWSLDANLLSILGLGEAEILGEMPTQVGHLESSYTLLCLHLDGPLKIEIILGSIQGGGPHGGGHWRCP